MRSPFSRRAVCSGLLATGLTRARAADAAPMCADGDTPAPAPRSSAPLGTAGRQAQWGVAIGEPGLSDARYIDLVATERPNFIAIANALKFDYRQPRGPASSGAKGNPATWTECDAVVALAQRLGVPVRGDCLAWNDWLPQWTKDFARDRPAGWQDTLRDSFDAHFKSVFAHFDALQHASGEQPLRWCGVVNEPFDPWTPRAGMAGWRAGAWLDAFGIEPDGVPGYIHRAFTLAARHAPRGTTLFLNETFCDTDRFGPLVRPALLQVVDALQRAGRDVGAVGLESHLMPQWMANSRDPDWTPFVAFLRDLSRRGVQIYLTELDVNDCSVRDVWQRDALVASYMKSFVSAALEVPAVSMVTNWDLSDKYSWWRDESIYRSMPKWADCVRDPPCPRPTPYDADMRPKRAQNALFEALGRTVGDPSRSQR